MSRRATLLLSLLALAAACEKAAKTPPPEPPVPEPADLLARLAVASPEGTLERVRAYADAVSAGSGAQLEARTLRQGLAFMVQTPALDGLDLAKPLHLLLLDPRKFARPLVIVGSVSDEAALKASSNVAVELAEGRAAVGEQSAVAAAAKYGFATAKLAAPAAPTVTVSPSKLVTRYRKEIDAMRAQMATALGQQSPAMARVLDTELDLFVRLADQTDRLQLVLDAQGGEASLELAMFPKAGTTFAGVAAAQKAGVDTRVRGALPAVDRPSMQLSGRYDLGPARGAVIDLMAQALPALASADTRARLESWLALFDGEVAAVMWTDAGGAMSMAEIFGVSDGAKAASAARELVGPLFSGEPTELMGMKMTFASKPAAAVVEGVEIDSYTMTLDLSAFPEAQRELTRKMYGGDAVTLHVAGVGKELAVTMGPDGAERMAAIVAAAKKGTAAPPLPAALAAAEGRKMSAALVLDYTQLLAPMLAAGARPAAASSGVLVELGVVDGAMRLRFAVPAEHVKDIGAMMAGAGAR